MVVTSYTDVPGPFIVRAEVTADNTSIRVSWEWSCQGVPMHTNHVRVHYQPEGGSLMMHTVGSISATTTTLPNLKCNTKYTIWVHAYGRVNDTTSDPRMVSLPERGMYMLQSISSSLYNIVCNSVLFQPHLLPLKSLFSSQVPQMSG